MLPTQGNTRHVSAGIRGLLAPPVHFNTCRPRARPLQPLYATEQPSSVATTLVSPTGESEREIRPGVREGYWQWRDFKVRYQRSGTSGPPLLLVHGFGGNADHWRKNIAVLAQQGYSVWAIDLLGYGYSAKPDPREFEPNTLYSFDNWGEQLLDFILEKIGNPTAIITNSVGGLAGLTAGIKSPELVLGVQLTNISLRGLHVDRQAPLARPFIRAFQLLLRDTPLGESFFGSVAQQRTVSTILKQAYCNASTVTDELVEVILRPGLQPGAARVFLDFISYSGGPLPEELIKQCPVPVSILWGEADPWEDVVMAKKLFAHQPSVVEFITLAGVGHCPQDEAPGLVNPLIAAFASKVASGSR